MKRSMILGFTFWVTALGIDGCKDQGSTPPPTSNRISTDEQFFNHITQTDSFVTYTLFPDVDSVAQGTLNGSNAHQPMVRVSMNALASAALDDDTLRVGTSFPDGSVIFKQIIISGQPTLYAVMYKDRTNAFAGAGWLWAEYHVEGTTEYSMSNRGGACVPCHSLERGLSHDFVRTFERRR